MAEKTKIYKLESLVGMSLEAQEFHVRRTHEIYETNDDGVYARSFGCLGSAKTASALAKSKGQGFKIRPVFALTNDESAIVLTEIIDVLDEAAVEKQIEDTLMASLSPEMQEFLKSRLK